MIIRWKNQDYSELKEMWTKSVDRKTFAHLVNWELDPNNQRTVQVDRITSSKIAEYLTKVTNYVTKVNDYSHNRTEIGEALYRKHTTGWLGDHYGFKEKEHREKDKSKG
jgi:molybdopterin-biosynthesis enzyme MoeA-like protein